MTSGGISGGDLARVALRRWKTLVALTAGCTALGFGGSYLFTPVYRAEAIVSPHLDSGGRNGAGALPGDIGGLASIFGLDMTGATAKYEAIELLRARRTTEQLVRDQQLLPVLYANRWDAARKTWREGARVPSYAEATDRFGRSIRTVTEDRRTGLVTVAVTWKDPDVAAAWAAGIVKIVNAEMRKSAIDEADRTLVYLDREIEKTNVLDMRNALYRLVESQQRNKVAAVVREDYAFKVVDPPTPPDRRDPVFPVRSLFAALGLLLGGLLAGAFVLVCANLERPSSRE